MKILLTLFCLNVYWTCFSQNEQPKNIRSQVNFKTQAGEFTVEPPTLICAGFEWMIQGDDNRNAAISVTFRKKGSETWQKGLPLLRIGGEKIYGHEQSWVYTTPPMFAGSIFYLDPGTEYECKFLLSDPDGVEGISEQIVVVQTKN